MSTAQISPTGQYIFDDFFPPAPAPEKPALLGDAISIGPLLGAAERVCDFLTVVAAVYCAFALHRARTPERQAQFHISTVLLFGAAFALMFIVLLERHGGYRLSLSLLGVRETERTLRVTVESFLLTLLVTCFTAMPVPRTVLLFALALVPVFLALQKREMYRWLCALRRRGRGTRRAVIFGAGEQGKRIFSALVRSPKFGLDPVAFVDDDPEKWGLEIHESSYRRERTARVEPGPVCPEFLRRWDASVLVVATSSLDRHSMMEIMRELSAAEMSTYFVPQDLSEASKSIQYDELDGIPLAHFAEERPRLLYEAVKRFLDVVLAAAALIFLAPVLPVIAALVKFTSPGPVLFRQIRVGKDGRFFPMYKFRTMFCDAPQYDYSPRAGADPRITPIGRFLRRTSLDEVAQLLNVLCGDMSLVGPRPEMPFIVEQYTPAQRQRLAVKPGITGLWQLSSDRTSPIHENMEYDLYYLTNNPRFLWDIGLQLSGLKRFEMN